MEFRDAVWRKSSFSGTETACVEVAYPEWRTSSYTADGSECVEVAYSAGIPSVGIRDSKNSAGGHLTIPDAALHHLTRALAS